MTVDYSLVQLYNRLFSCVELTDPVGVSAEVLQWLEVRCTCYKKNFDSKVSI